MARSIRSTIQEGLDARRAKRKGEAKDVVDVAVGRVRTQSQKQRPSLRAESGKGQKSSDDEKEEEEDKAGRSMSASLAFFQTFSRHHASASMS